jgi:hypothetical protein
MRIYLTKQTESEILRDPWLQAVQSDYSVPEVSEVFAGEDGEGSRVAFWIAPDGSGFGAIDHDPESYVAFSQSMARGAPDFDIHPGVDEYTFDPGEWDPDLDELEVDTRRELF